MKRTTARMSRRIWILAMALSAAELLSGCLVAGVSSSGGWFIWPGSFGFLIVLFLLFLLLRRRR